RIVESATTGMPTYVSIANVHMTMETVDDPGFREIVNASALVTPDGMPLVWSLRRMGLPNATRVYGPTLTLHVCEAAAAAGLPVGFYGGSAKANAGIVSHVRSKYPDLEVAYAYSPPFRT